MNQLVPIASPALPKLVAAAGERAGMRFLEFFAANIRNPHTRRAYARAAGELLAWCASAGVPSIGAVQPTPSVVSTSDMPAVKSAGNTSIDQTEIPLAASDAEMPKSAI